MATDVAKRIEASKALTPKERRANREAVKELASKHMEKAISKLSEIISDKNAPASAKVAASTQLLDRVAGKPKLVDEKNTAESEMDRMSEAQLLSMICSTIAGLSQESQAIIAEAMLCAQRGIGFDPRTIDPNFSESEALKAENEPAGLPPLEPTRPRKEPRR